MKSKYTNWSKFQIKKYILLWIAGFILFFSGNAQQIIKSNQGNSKSSVEKSCLVEITDPAQWYPISKVASLADVTQASINHRTHKKSNTIQYRWKSDRTHQITVEGKEKEVPSSNIITINISNLDSARIVRSFQRKNVAKPSYSNLLATYHVNASSKGPYVQNDPPTENYIKLEDLGDEAHSYVQIERGIRDTRLVVLHKNMAVLVNVDVSDDDGKDLALAMEVVKSIIGHCD